MNFSSSFLHSAKLLDFTHRNRFWLTGQRLGSGCYREAELAVFTLYAAGDDLSLVQVDNRAHDVQPQTHAGLVHASGAVGFVESVEHLGNFILRDAVARIFDVDVGALGVHRIADLDIRLYTT